MKHAVSLLFGLALLLIAAIICMQVSITDIQTTIVNIYSHNGAFSRTDGLQVDSLAFCKMNRQRTLPQCQSGSCTAAVEIKNTFAIHDCISGKIFYKYSLMYYDENHNKVSGCADVLAWVKISKRNGKWWIADFHEQP